MANSRKFVAKTKDVSLTVKRAESFSISYVDCKKRYVSDWRKSRRYKILSKEKRRRLVTGLVG